MQVTQKPLMSDFLGKTALFQFIIPVYQRNYTWKKNLQVEKLIDDINKLKRNPESTHFLGSIITYPTHVGNVTELSVVDGQQRITTIFLLIHALKKIVIDISLSTNQSETNKTSTMQAIDYTFKGYIQNNFWQKDSPEARKYKYRLKPQVADDDAFKYIADENYDELKSISNSSQIKQNFYYLVDQFKSTINSLDDAISMLSVLNQLYIVDINLDKNDNAQEIFESINSTGAKLTQSDLIRNYILMDKPDQIQETLYEKYWKKFESNTNHGEKLDTFFRFYLASKLYYLMSSNNIYEEFKKYWTDQLQSHSETEILDQIKQSSTNYHRLYISKEADSFGYVMDTFRAINMETHAPFVLGLFDLYDNKSITEKELKESINITNIYFIRRFLASKESNDISRLFPTTLGYIQKLYSESKKVDNYPTNFLTILKSELLFKNMNTNGHLPTDEEIIGNLRNTNFYNMKRSKWFLSNIENYDSNGRASIIDNSRLSVEHIMPQTREGDWKKITNRLDDSNYANLINTIGNLTLVDGVDNSQMQNNNFEFKKKILKKSSHIKMNMEILEQDHWDKSCIERRTTKLSEILLKLYPYIESTPYIFDENKKLYIYDKNNNVIATGYDMNGFFAVLKGSFISLDTEAKHDIEEIRSEAFINNQIEEISEGKYLLKEDQIFKNSSSAAVFVLGGLKRNHSIWKPKRHNNKKKQITKTSNLKRLEKIVPEMKVSYLKDQFIAYLYKQGKTGQTPEKYASALNTAIKKLPNNKKTKNLFELNLDEIKRFSFMIENASSDDSIYKDHGTTRAAIRLFNQMLKENDY